VHRMGLRGVCLYEMSSMTTLHPQVSLPTTDRAVALAKECVELQCLGVIAGKPGTGKTVALQTILARYPTLGLPGTCVYYRAYSAEGGTRAVRDLLEGLGVRPTLVPPAAPLQLVVKAALRELQAREVRLLCVDEADSYTGDSLKGLISLYDAALQSGHPVSAVLAGGQEAPKWLAEVASGLSRTVRVEEFAALSPELTLGVLKKWDPRFVDFAGEVTAGSKDARRAASAIGRMTGGNLRRLSYFAKLLQMHYPEGPIVPECVETVGELLLKIE